MLSFYCELVNRCIGVTFGITYVITILLSILVTLRVISLNRQREAIELIVSVSFIFTLYVIPAVLITLGHYLTVKGKRSWGSALLSIGSLFYIICTIFFFGGLAYFLGWLGLVPIVGLTLTLCLMFTKKLKEIFWIGHPER
jgi:hypothetical protein